MRARKNAIKLFWPCAEALSPFFARFEMLVLGGDFLSKSMQCFWLGFALGRAKNLSGFFFMFC